MEKDNEIVSLSKELESTKSKLEEVQNQLNQSKKSQNIDDIKDDF